MTMIADFYTNHPMWTWLSIGAVLLTIEVITGTGWACPARSWSSRCFPSPPA